VKKAKADKKAKAMGNTDAAKTIEHFIYDYKPTDIRVALLQLTQAKRNFLRRAIDKVDLMVEKKSDKTDKSDKIVDKQADKKEKFVREIVRVKKNGTPMKTVYVSFKELAATLKKGQTVEVVIYNTLGEGRGKARFLKEYKMVTKIAKDKHSVKKSKRSIETA